MNILFLVPTYGTFKEIIEPTALLHKQITVVSYNINEPQLIPNTNTCMQINDILYQSGGDVMVICIPGNIHVDVANTIANVSLLVINSNKTCIIYSDGVEYDYDDFIKELINDSVLLITNNPDNFLLTLAEVTKAQGLLKNSTN